MIGNSLIISTKAKIVAVSIDGLIRGSIIFIKLKVCHDGKNERFLALSFLTSI